MSTAAFTPEHGPQPNPEAERDPHITGGVVLRVAENQPSLSREDLVPPEALELAPYTHERRIIRAINDQLPENAEPYFMNRRAAERIEHYLHKNVIVTKAKTDRTDASNQQSQVVKSRSELVDKRNVIREVLEELTTDNPDSPVQTVFAHYETIARAIKRPRSDARMFSDRHIQQTLLRTLAMMHEPLVREKLAQQIELAKQTANQTD